MIYISVCVSHMFLYVCVTYIHSQRIFLAAGDSHLLQITSINEWKWFQSLCFLIYLYCSLWWPGCEQGYPGKHVRCYLVFGFMQIKYMDGLQSAFSLNLPLSKSLWRGGRRLNLNTWSGNTSDQPSQLAFLTVRAVLFVCTQKYPIPFFCLGKKKNHQLNELFSLINILHLSVTCIQQTSDNFLAILWFIKKIQHIFCYYNI